MFGYANRKHMVVALPTVKTADVTKYVCFGGPVKILGVKLVADATLAAHDDNKCTVTLTNVGKAGAGTDVVATSVNTVAGKVLTAKVPKDVAVDAANDTVEAGEALEVKSVEAGTLGADPTINVVIEYVNL